jgi:hypothetical protein
MPDRIDTGEGAHPPPINALLRRGEGYGWLEGCGVTLTGSPSDIEVRVGAGRVRVGGQARDIAATTKTLGDGDAQYPRKDLIAVDYQGDVRVIPGDPATPDPSDRTDEFTKSPAPPSTAAFDGALLAEVWVPAGATSTADLDPTDIADRRVADAGGVGAIPVVDQRPAETDLVQTRWWYNTNAGQLEAYIADTDSIITWSTSTVTSFSGSTTRVVEDFEDSIGGNWRGGSSTLDYTTPAFSGSASGLWNDGGISQDYSLVGDGLSYYAEAGDTVTMAVYFEGGDYVDLGFAKSADDYTQDYAARLSRAAGALRLVKTASDGSETVLGSASVTVSDTTWYWVEVDYDGGGEGVHPCRVYSTDTSSDPGTKDTELAAVGSPTKDTDYRGRGYIVRFVGDVRADYLTAVTA